MSSTPVSRIFEQLQLLFDSELAPRKKAEREKRVPVDHDTRIRNYRLIRSARKTLSLSVEDAQLIVRAPRRAPKYWIEEFIAQKQGWIEQQLKLEEQQLANKLRLQNGLQFTLAGHPKTLRYTFDPGRKVCRYSETADSLDIVLPEQDPAGANFLLHRTFFRWLNDRALKDLTTRTRNMAEQFNLSDKLGSIRLRRTRSKWGHCTSSGDIQYNPLIMLAPPSVINYLVAHELAHLQHRNHSRRFWTRVEKMDPDYRQAEQWLKDEGYRLAIDMPAKPTV